MLIEVLCFQVKVNSFAVAFEQVDSEPSQFGNFSQQVLVKFLHFFTHSFILHFFTQNKKVNGACPQTPLDAAHFACSHVQPSSSKFSGSVSEMLPSYLTVPSHLSRLNEVTKTCKKLNS